MGRIKELNRKATNSKNYGSWLIIATIIFAWLPASLLILLYAFTLYHATLALFTNPQSEFLILLGHAIAAFAGYAGLCSVCFGFKIPPVRRVLFLIAGMLAMILPFRLMYYRSPNFCMHDQALFSSLFIPLFLIFALGPLIFGAIHIALHIRYLKHSKT